jgi:phosphoribosylformimino-5-aminoimidazole carboxamide ribotide isomerase
MILVIPALEIQNGECSYCIKGEFGTEQLYQEYSHNPEHLCRLLRRENSKSLHITDFDSINNDSKENIESIIRLVKSIDIPFQLLFRFQNVEECRYLLNNGIYRLVIDQNASLNSDDIKSLISDYTSSRIAFYISAQNTSSLLHDLNQNVSNVEYAAYLKALGANRIVYCDKKLCNSTDDTGYDDVIGFAESSKMRITLFEGVSNSSQLWKVQKLVSKGIDSVVIGKAIFENKFPCQKIWRLIEADLEPSINQ